MELTQPVDWLEKPFEGYVVNTVFSEANTALLKTLISEISTQFPAQFYPTPAESLHVTLLDWIAPLVDYDGKDKSEIFSKIRGPYERALAEALASSGPIGVRFKELVITPTTIIIKGADNGSFQQIREGFLGRVELLNGTKLPPQIIHCSLGRFTKELPLIEVENFLRNKSIDLEETFDNFRLVHTKKEPMLEYEVLKIYPLA